MWDSNKQQIPPMDFQQPPSQPPQFPQQTPQFQQQSQPQVVVYNIPASSVPTYPAVQPVQQNESWMKRNRKNKPQSNSVGTGALIFISGGMNMAWKLGLDLNFNLDFPITEHLISSWFIGGIIGAVIGAFICNRIPKKFVFCFSSILVIICGILQVTDVKSYDTILASRYLNGIAVGLIFPLTFVMVGEECVKNIRGTNAAGVDIMSFSAGIFVQVVYTFSWTNDLNTTFPAIRMCGIFNILWGSLALIFAAILVIESPVLFLARGEEQSAIDALRRLQRPFTITYETYEQLEEHKRYLAESKERTFMENALYGLPALLKLCFYRSFMALSFSYFINYAFTYSSLVVSQYATWSFMIYALARWLGPLLVTFTLDSKGRKQPLVIGFLVCSILTFTIGAIFDDKQNILSSYYMDVVMYLLIFYQLFASMSMASSSVYLSEAFPLAVKPYYISIVFIVEMLIQIIIISYKDGNILLNIFKISDYFLTLGALSLVFFIVAILIMPETKGLNLRECLIKFRKLKNIH